MMNGQTPWESIGTFNKLESMMRLDNLDLKKCGSDLSALIRKLLSPNKNARITVNAIFTDPWVVNMKAHFNKRAGKEIFSDDGLRFNGNKMRCSYISYSSSLDVSSVSVSDMSEIDFSIYNKDHIGNVRPSG
jgi:hypothetical protein